GVRRRGISNKEHPLKILEAGMRFIASFFLNELCEVVIQVIDKKLRGHLRKHDDTATGGLVGLY
ncbi:MAG: hypothetical protein JXR21_05175, partial [Candidatus Marinimicrobia bacterium]|nr:hypothetical protein [Candidatus Neomarinimicrobiota bacterium]